MTSGEVTEPALGEDDLEPDPLWHRSLRSLAARLADREITARELVTSYLSRIDSLDDMLSAFRVVDANGAMEQATKLDHRSRSGSFAGNLIAIPVGVKEIVRVEGLPFGANSRVDVADLVASTGPFVRRLRASGAIPLGATKTTELAATTIELDADAPWNPCDLEEKRVCGGSSHGSAVAVAAGMSPWAVGTDTGGSVRLPAALCGVVGFKGSRGLWSMEGIFGVSPTLDAVGLFSRTVDDLAFVAEALGVGDFESPPPLKELRLAVEPRLFEGLDEDVEIPIDRSLGSLERHGVTLVEVDLPEIDEVPKVFPDLLFGELLEALGPRRVALLKETANRVLMDRLTRHEATSPEALRALRRRQDRIVSSVAEKLTDVDALVAPTTPSGPTPYRLLDSVEKEAGWNRRAGRNTRVGNLFDMCGITMPIHKGEEMPVGLQLLASPGSDARLISMGLAVEGAIARDRLGYSTSTDRLR